MSDAAKVPAVTPQEAEASDVLAFLMLRRTGRDYAIHKCHSGSVVSIRLPNSPRKQREGGVTMMDAVMKLAEKMPDVFDPAANGGKD